MPTEKRDAVITSSHSAGQRMSAKVVLEDAISRRVREYSREINELELLLKVIDWDHLTKDEESTLWFLFYHTKFWR